MSAPVRASCFGAGVDGAGGVAGGVAGLGVDGVGVVDGIGVGVTDGVGVGFASPFASPEPSEWMSTPPVYSFALMSASLWKVTPLRTVPKLLIVASYCRM